MPTLLYIDDDDALARLVERGLTRQGFNVVRAASGDAGLERLQQGGIDVVALDQYMPGLDGLETLEQIIALKFLGLPLKEIEAVLKRPAMKLPATLRLQREALEERYELLGRAIRAIREDIRINVGLWNHAMTLLDG